jgi:hypothetical protein
MAARPRYHVAKGGIETLASRLKSATIASTSPASHAFT